MGQTFRFESNLPKLDDASTLLEKAGAFRSLVAIGFDAKDTIKAVGLDHIKWTQLPPQLDPNAVAVTPPQPNAGITATVADSNRGDASQVSQSLVSKATKSRETIADSSIGRVQSFLFEQRERLSDRIRETFPRAKAARVEATKGDDWFDKDQEDRLLREALRGLYLDASRGSLQVVADALNRIVANKAVASVMADIIAYGGERIVGINARTLEALTLELAEGTRRGYSIPQLIDGVPDEGYLGVKGVALDNGTPVFGDARAETIARTETALSYNRAALDAYKEFSVRNVIAYDGDFDEECAARNGQEFTVEEAFGIEDHPNGTLDWAPVVDKAAHFDERDMMKAMVELAGNMRPVINATGVDFPVTLDTEPLALVVRDIETAIKGQPAPIVNIPAPPPAQIVVTPAKAQGVQDVRLVDSLLPPRKRKVKRDNVGRITEVYEE